MDKETQATMHEWREAVRVLWGKGRRKTKIRPAPAQLKTRGSILTGGRPLMPVNLALILHYRDGLHYGWLRIANEYQKNTHDFISKETCKRRYIKAKKEAKNDN